MISIAQDQGLNPSTSRTNTGISSMHINQFFFSVWDYKQKQKKNNNLYELRKIYNFDLIIYLYKKLYIKKA